MSAVMKSPIHSAYINYIAHGFALVPIASGKGPTTAGWNERHNCWTTPEQVDDTVGVGLAHAYSNTCALDIDDLDLARAWLAERGVNLDELLDAADAVQISSGNPGHAKLIYRIASPLSSKKITVNGKTALEFRCATANGKTVQDVLPSMVLHPTTGQYYKWVGRGHWTAIPDLPFMLSLIWQQLLTEDEAAPAPTPAAAVDLDEAKSAMMAIDPNCSRDVWIEVGMAWHSAGGDFDTWDTWSKGSIDKYPSNREMVKQWQSFKPDRAISIATLYHHAIEGGWKKPAPDVSSLFTNVQATTPEVLTESLRPVPPTLDLSVFPDVLANRASEIAIQRGCDPIVPLFAGLAAVSGALDKRIKLELAHRYEVTPIIWLMTVGEPGDKKTPGSKPMFEPLQDIEYEDKPHYREAHLFWEAQEAMYSAAKRAYLEHHQSADALLDNSLAPAVPELPPEPVPLRLLVSDITSQKLVRIAATQPRGLLCYLDEMGGWINKLNDPRSGEDRGCWLRAYEGGSYQMDRVTSGSVEAENLAVSIYGNIQPHIFRNAIDKMGTDGLLQRFIPGVLRSDLTGKGKPVASALFTTEAAWSEVLRRTYTISPVTYRLSESAAVEFDRFQDWFEQQRRDNRLLNANVIFQTAFSKLESTVGRIALLMHVLIAPYETHVSGDTFRQAVMFIRSYVMPSLQYTYLEVSGLFESSLEKWVMDYVIYHSYDKTQFTLSEIKRSARRQVDGKRWDADRILRDAIAYVEEAGWVALVEDNRQSTIWAINPAIKDKFTAQRKAVIDAKQRAMDTRREIVLKAGSYTERRIVPGYDGE